MMLRPSSQREASLIREASLRSTSASLDEKEDCSESDGEVPLLVYEGVAGEWTVKSWDTYASQSCFEVRVGSEHDTRYHRTCLFGLSTAREPELVWSKEYKTFWPGKSLRGWEVHTMGIALGWKNADPLFQNPSKAELVSNVLSGERFQVAFHEDSVILLLEWQPLHKFKPTEDFSSHQLFFHLYTQDGSLLEKVDAEVRKTPWNPGVGLTRQIAWMPAGRGKKKSSSEHTCLETTMTNIRSMTLEEDDGSHSDRLFDVCLLGDGRFLASGAHDGLVKIWNTWTGHCNLTLHKRNLANELAMEMLEKETPRRGVTHVTMKRKYDGGRDTLCDLRPDQLKSIAGQLGMQVPDNESQGELDSLVTEMSQKSEVPIDSLCYLSGLEDVAATALDFSSCAHVLAIGRQDGLVHVIGFPNPLLGPKRMALETRRLFTLDHTTGESADHRLLSDRHIIKRAFGRDDGVYTQVFDVNRRLLYTGNELQVSAWRFSFEIDVVVTLKVQCLWRHPVRARQLALSCNGSALAVASSRDQCIQVFTVGNRWGAEPPVLFRKILHSNRPTCVTLAVTSMAKYSQGEARPTCVTHGPSFQCHPTRESEDDDHDDEALFFGDSRGDVFCYHDWRSLPASADSAIQLPDRQFPGHSNISVRRCVTMPAVSNAESYGPATGAHFLVTSAHGSVQVSALYGSHSWMLVGQQGAISCVATIAREYPPNALELDGDQRDKVVQSVIYTGSWDCSLVRWSLTDIVKRRPRGGVIGDEFHQLTYIDPATKDLFLAPLSWTWALFQLGESVWVDSGTFNPLTTQLPWLVSYWIHVGFAYVAILLLTFDVFARLRERLQDIYQESDFLTNPQRKRAVIRISHYLRLVSYTLVVISQVCWLWIFTSLLIPLDCAKIKYLQNTHTSFPVNATGETRVLEIDTTVECYTGWHAFLAAHSAVAAVLFLLVTAPLQIAGGQIRRLDSVPTWGCFRRFCNRMNPCTWLRPSTSLWPQYVGLFTKHHEHFYFEIALLYQKIAFPCIQMLTTHEQTWGTLALLADSFLLFWVGSRWPIFKNRRVSDAFTCFLLGLVLSVFVRFMTLHLQTAGKDSGEQ